MSKHLTREAQEAFSSQSFADRLTSMLAVDLRRMVSTPLFPVMLLCSLAMPILILVMTSMAGGMEVTDPTTGVTSTMSAFTNAWQAIGQESSAGMAMDMTAMCNINLMYFMVGVFVCLFVGADFSSGYAKNLFTVRAQRGDYVASKTIVGCIAGTAFLLAFLIGTLLGGSLAGLPFTLGAAGVPGLVMCMVAKAFLMAVFVAIFVLTSVFGKRRTWLSILLALFGGMLLFMMVPMMTPLDSGVGNVGICLAGGLIFAVAIGFASTVVLSRSNLA